MTFIKLSNSIINSSSICSIRMYNNKYYINLIQSSISGTNFIFAGTGLGMIDGNENKFEICKENNKDDYIIMTNWIDKQTTN
jgi:hypothetical protein